MEKKQNRKKAPYNPREDILDYQIDLSELSSKKRQKLLEDGKIYKIILEEGKGTEAKINATVYYCLETRYPSGILCNPRDDRKGLKKLVLKNDPQTKAFEIALLGARFAADYWVVLEGPFLDSLKYYKDLPASEEVKLPGGKERILWCHFRIAKIKHALKDYFYDFASLITWLDEIRERAKEYLSFAESENDYYLFDPSLSLLIPFRYLAEPSNHLHDRSWKLEVNCLIRLPHYIAELEAWYCHKRDMNYRTDDELRCQSLQHSITSCISCPLARHLRLAHWAEKSSSKSR